VVGGAALAVVVGDVFGRANGGMTNGDAVGWTEVELWTQSAAAAALVVVVVRDGRA